MNETSTDSGRRVSRYEFPYQEKPVAQDLGKQGQVILLSGFVSGANYRSDAERLLKQCETQGAGELFHPYYGRRMVFCRSCRVSENNVEGGIVYFSLQFIETTDTAVGRFGLQNLPLLGAQGGGQALKDASESITNAIDQANQGVGYLDSLNDSILMSVEFLEKAFSPILHAQDAIGNLALALNEVRRTVKHDLYAGTQGLSSAFRNLIAVIAGSQLSDVDPYNWRRDFASDRWNATAPPVQIINAGTIGILVGFQATHVFTRLQGYPPKRQLAELQSLKGNTDLALSHCEKFPSLYRSLKSVQTQTIHELFNLALSSPDLREKSPRPTKCLILEAYEERGGLQVIDSMIDSYKYAHPCFND